MRDRLDRWVRSKVFTSAVYRYPWLVDRLNRAVYFALYGAWE